jgi:hypothetical protein
MRLACDPDKRKPEARATLNSVSLESQGREHLPIRP